jgi:membrane protease YdiL (CAAX protease family)
MLSQFDTTRSMGNFAVILSLSILVEALLNAVIIFLIVGASEPLYREQNPTRLSLSKSLTFRFFKTKEFFSGTLVGYSLALFHIGYVVLFYYFGRRAGIWSPAEVGYTDALSTFLPWIYPLTVSLTASLTEEFLFRVFAISVLRKFLPTWMAVLIPAFLWGFLHSNYPQQPSFIRGIEVGILGIIAGYIFLRWGILATLIWHYTIDAVFVGLFLFNSTNLYFIFSGAIVMGLLLIPMMLAFFGLLKERRFATSSGLLNRDVSEAMNRKRGVTEPRAPQIRRKPIELSVQTFSKKNVGFLLALTVVSLLFLILLETPKPWPSIQLRVNRSRAEALAADHLREKDVETAPFYHVVSYINHTGAYEDRYIQNVAGWTGVREAYRLFKETGRWRVRFFIPMSEEEYIVSMNDAGQDHVLFHLLPETKEASSMSKEGAKEKAEQYLQEERKVPLEEYVLVDSYEDRKPSRTDYYFVWKWEKAKAGDGEYRLSVSMAGDEISQYSKFIKVPEKWIRKDREEGIFQIFFSFLKVLMLSLGGGLAIVLFARDFLHRQIEWKRVLILPSCAVLFYTLLEMNRLPILLADYRTSLSLSNYFLSEILTRLLNTAGLFLFLLILTTAMLSLLRETYGGVSLWPKRVWFQRETLGYSLAAALSAFFIITAFTRIFAWINDALDIPRAKIAGESLLSVETYFPLLEILSGSLIYALVGTIFIFFGFFLYQRYLRKAPYLIMVALPAIALYFIAEVNSISEFMLLFTASFIAFTIVFSMLERFIQGNVFACFLALLWMKAIPQGLWLVSQPLWFYRIHGFLSLVIVLLPLLWILILFYKRNKKTHHS